MVPDRIDDIPAATLAAIDRLMDRITKDRESFAKSGYGDAPAGIALLNAVANAADELKKAITSPTVATATPETTIATPLEPEQNRSP